MTPLALTAAKCEAYRAMPAAGLNKRQLAERLGWQPSQAAGLFDGGHASGLDEARIVAAAVSGHSPAAESAFSTHIELGPRDDRFSIPELIRSR